MLKPLALELFVAVLLKLPGRKKDVMSAAPAATMSRLNTHETTVLVRGFFIFINLEIVTRGFAPAR
jgi:hypothetical protein